MSVAGLGINGTAAATTTTKATMLLACVHLGFSRFLVAAGVGFFLDDKMRQTIRNDTPHVVYWKKKHQAHC